MLLALSIGSRAVLRAPNVRRYAAAVKELLEDIAAVTLSNVIAVLFIDVLN